MNGKGVPLFIVILYRIAIVMIAIGKHKKKIPNLRNVLRLIIPPSLNLLLANKNSKYTEAFKLHA